MWVATASATGALVAVLSAIATIGGFLAYLYFVQRSDATAAREEALALAEMRRQVIADLRARLSASDRRRKRLRANYEKRIRKLEGAVERAQTEAREQAYQMQRLYAIGLADMLEGARSDLQAVPPNVESALRASWSCSPVRGRLPRTSPRAGVKPPNCRGWASLAHQTRWARAGW